MANIAEILPGQLGIQQAESSELREFCQELVTEHTRDYKNVQFAASQCGIHIQQQTDPLHSLALLRLAKLHGADFDKELTRQLLRDQVASIAQFEAATEFLKEPQAAKIAFESVPVLRDHFQACKFVAGDLGMDEEIIQGAIADRLREFNASLPSTLLSNSRFQNPDHSSRRELQATPQ
jgi:predicted outer membrane protein